jgi:hypothetical protein
MDLGVKAIRGAPCAIKNSLAAIYEQTHLECSSAGGMVGHCAELRFIVLGRIRRPAGPEAAISSATSGRLCLSSRTDWIQGGRRTTWGLLSPADIA